MTARHYRKPPRRIALPDGRQLSCDHHGVWWVSRPDVPGFRLRVGPGEARMMLERAGVTEA